MVGKGICGESKGICGENKGNRAPHNHGDMNIHSVYMLLEEHMHHVARSVQLDHDLSLSWRYIYSLQVCRTSPEYLAHVTSDSSTELGVW